MLKWYTQGYHRVYGLHKGIKKTVYVSTRRGISSEANLSDSSSKEDHMVLSEEHNQLWHSRMGHIGQKGLEELANKGCFGTKRVSEIKFCEDCIMGKTHRTGFRFAQHVTRNKLDNIHSDLWGSSNVPYTLSKCQYFILFTDDFSQNAWIYLLRHKDEAFRNFV